jgi:hypothetical protein
LIPPEHSIIIVESELEGARAWAARHALDIEWKPELLELRATLVQRSTGDPFYLRGQFTDFREMPPFWDFTDSAWCAGGVLANFPKTQSPAFGSPVFLQHNNQGVICVPFNRLAYRSNGGPHGDWGDSTAWLTAGLQYAHADHVGDMLQIILRDFSRTDGRMG